MLFCFVSNRILFIKKTIHVLFCLTCSLIDRLWQIHVQNVSKFVWNPFKSPYHYTNKHTLANPLSLICNTFVQLPFTCFKIVQSILPSHQIDSGVILLEEIRCKSLWGFKGLHCKGMSPQAIKSGFKNSLIIHKPINLSNDR